MNSKCIRIFGFAVVCVLMVALPAFASGAGDHAGGDHGGEKGLLHWDLGAALWSIAVFVVLLLILRVAAWKPILKGLNDRENFITSSIQDAKIEREKAEQMMAEYTAKLEAAGDKAGEIVEEARRDADETRKRIVAEAKAEAEAAADRAKRDIELARNDAVKRMHDDAIELATAVASKLIQKELNASDHQALIDESLSELNRMNN